MAFRRDKQCQEVVSSQYLRRVSTITSVACVSEPENMQTFCVGPPKAGSPGSQVRNSTFILGGVGLWWSLPTRSRVYRRLSGVSRERLPTDGA